jgi:TonB family protein
LLRSTALPTVGELLRRTDFDSGSGAKLQAFGLGEVAPMAAAPLTATAVDEPVGIIRQPLPLYPSAMAQAGITGRVELASVVDSMGRVEPGSVRTLNATHPAFEAAAHASVLASRYRPARVRGRAVRQLVRQTISFRLGP